MFKYDKEKKKLIKQGDVVRDNFVIDKVLL